MAFSITHQNLDAGDAYVLGPIMPADLRQIFEEDLRAESSIAFQGGKPTNRFGVQQVFRCKCESLLPLAIHL